MKFMKKKRVAAFSIALLLPALLGCPGLYHHETYVYRSSPAPAPAGVSFEFFYSNLSPYGSWVVSTEYGRVWQPQVYSAGWNPYYDGHWVYTDLGWTWVSAYEWGALPYHYGTWVLDPVLGWAWVPGYVWAPSWVVFRTGPGYVGWAPVPPRFAIGISVGHSEPAFGSFVFVSTDHFLSPRVRNYVIPGSRTRTVFNQTRIVNRITIQNDIVVNRGPDPERIERETGRRLRPVPIEQVRRVAPGPRPRRDDLRIEPERRREGGLRAAEPVPKHHPLPPGKKKKDKHPDREKAPGHKDKDKKEKHPSSGNGHGHP